MTPRHPAARCCTRSRWDTSLGRSSLPSAAVAFLCSPRLCFFIAASGFSGFFFGRKLAAFARRPAGLVDLPATGNRESVGGNVVSDRRSCRHVPAIADAQRRYQRGVAADKHSIADSRGIFVKAIVIAGDGSPAEVGFRANFRVAEI